MPDLQPVIDGHTGGLFAVAVKPSQDDSLNADGLAQQPSTLLPTQLARAIDNFAGFSGRPDARVIWPLDHPAFGGAQKDREGIRKGPCHTELVMTLGRRARHQRLWPPGTRMRARSAASCGHSQKLIATSSSVA